MVSVFNIRKNLSTLGLQLASDGEVPGPDQIHQAWKKLAMETHPDKVPENRKEEAKEKFQEINEAYASLIKKDDMLEFQLDNFDDLDTLVMETLNTDAESLEKLNDLLFQGMRAFFNENKSFFGGAISLDFNNDDHFRSFVERESRAKITQIEEEEGPPKNKDTQYRLQFSFQEAYHRVEKEIEFDNFKTVVAWSSEGKIVFYGRGHKGGDLIVSTEFYPNQDVSPLIDYESQFPDVILKAEVPLEHLLTHDNVIKVPFLNKVLKITRKINGKETLKLYGKSLEYVFKEMGMPITKKEKYQGRGNLILRLLPVYNNQ